MVWIDHEVLSQKAARNPKTLADFINSQIKDINGNYVSGINKDSNTPIRTDSVFASEYQWSKYSQNLSKYSKTIHKRKMNAVQNIVEIIETANNKKLEPTRHTNSKNASLGMARYFAHIGMNYKEPNGKINQIIYDVELLARITSDGKEHAYDIVGIKENPPLSQIAQKMDKSGAFAAPATSRGLSKTMVPQGSSQVNTQKSVREPESTQEDDSTVDSESAIQHSLREDAESESSIWDFIEHMENREDLSSNELRALFRFRAALNATNNHWEAVERYRDDLNKATTADERTAAQNRLKIAQERYQRAYLNLEAAINTDEYRALERRSREFIRDYISGRTPAELAAMVTNARQTAETTTRRIQANPADPERAELIRQRDEAHRLIRQLTAENTKRLVAQTHHYEELIRKDKELRRAMLETERKRRAVENGVKWLDKLIRNETD